ncbi:hypothetical protein BN159_1319 [Streptomyces davaonensis JCM 4913]|uniref:Uncharacterized protein n=1 Tax=Streptomyces davaonensis (strain DSM 101723 / JCM 4913 / KCC S-0913 / 768) TaxID=1214101 RepID=K4QXC4_STRDJ|nr:hypothetical protein BN159_1319 [Streptomyces davaonensis JCM 4913]
MARSPGAQDTAAVLTQHGATRLLTHEAAGYADYPVVPKVDALRASYDAVSPAAVHHHRRLGRRRLACRG